MILQVFLDQAQLRLAATAGFVQEVRADEHGLEVDTLRGEQVESEPAGAIEGVLRQRRRAQPVLVRDHHQSKSCSLQGEEGGDDVGQQTDFLEPVHALIGRLLDERAVAIDEQDAPGRAGPGCAGPRRGGPRRAHAASRLSIRASFSARVPTEILSALGSVGFARKSRTSVPPALLARRKRSASALSTRRKLVALGHTWATKGNRSSRERR